MSSELVDSLIGELVSGRWRFMPLRTCVVYLSAEAFIAAASLGESPVVELVIDQRLKGLEMRAQWTV